MPAPAGTRPLLETPILTKPCSEPAKATKEKPATYAERRAREVTHMDLKPRNPVTVAPRIPTFEQMLGDGDIFLADATLREALGPDYDGLDVEVRGFCVKLYRLDGEWRGFASTDCGSNREHFAEGDYVHYDSPKKQGAAWLFETEGESINITRSGGGALSVTLFDPATESWSPPVELRPSESVYARDSRWSRDAHQAFLEQAAAEEPRLVERRHGHWEYERRPLARCGLWAWECDQGKLTLVCGKNDDREHVLIRHADRGFTFLRVRGELDMGECAFGPFAGIGLLP